MMFENSITNSEKETEHMIQRVSFTTSLGVLQSEKMDKERSRLYIINMKPVLQSDKVYQ
jgi:hypothetical protein